jgi:hypothetical protein
MAAAGNAAHILLGVVQVKVLAETRVQRQLPACITLVCTHSSLVQLLLVAVKRTAVSVQQASCMATERAPPTQPLPPAAAAAALAQHSGASLLAAAVQNHLQLGHLCWLLTGSRALSRWLHHKQQVCCDLVTHHDKHVFEHADNQPSPTLPSLTNST